MATQVPHSFRESKIEEQKKSVFCEYNLTLLSELDINDLKQNDTPISPTVLGLKIPTY